MNQLQRSLLKRLFALFLFVSSILIFHPDPAFSLSVNALGDYDNIAVVEVSGDYAALNANGDANLLPRQQVSQEFYNHHGDDYDFLVIFTNFDFPMPSSGTKAFFVPVKNDIEGIGLNLYDNTNLYSADGAFLDRLEGLVDMANISSHALEPTDPDFEKTLLFLTHEVLHRWGAYLSFMDDGQESDALLGLDNAHWSFLLDSQGSSLYGNNWQDNGDGTYTSVAPEQSHEGSYLGRIFSPLELYLMGLSDRQQVPPMTLIDSPGIDRNRLSEVGVTIPGSVKTITMDQVVSAMGERVPAADPDKVFRMAFIYLVNPDSWSSEDSESLRQLRLIRNLQVEWEKRFSILTGGTSLMQTDLIREEEESSSNPGVLLPSTTPHVAPHVNEGVNWLVANQDPSGYWQDQVETAQRDTATAVVALKSFPVSAATVAAGQSWLNGITPENNDFLSRKLLSFTSTSQAEIESLQNADGGWGSASGYRSNPVDSALVLKALTASGSTNMAVLDAAVTYLHAVQGADGGWNAGSGASMVQPTAYVLLALNDYRDNPNYSLESVVADGMAWLTARQNGDGGFGNSSSTVYDTAIALSTLKATGGNQASTLSAINYLLSRQANSGSWNNSVFQTAMAVEALYAAQGPVALPETVILSPVAGRYPDETVPLLYTLSEGEVQEISLNGNLIANRSGDLLGPLADGDYTLSITAEDSFGQTSVAVRHFSIAKDTSMPARVTENPPEILWEREIIRTGYWEEGTVTLDVEGNYYFATRYANEVINGYEVFVYKLDRYGNPLWPEAVKIDLPFNTYLGGILVDGCGNVYIASETKDVVHFTDGTIAEDWDYDLYAAKISKDGVLEWVYTWGSIQGDNISSSFLSEDGLLYMTGRSEGPISGAYGDNPDDEVFVTIIDSYGNAKLNKNFPGKRGDSIVSDRYGNFYIRAGSQLRKYSPMGNLVWQKTFNDMYVSANISFDLSGDLLLSGFPIRKIDASNGDVIWLSETIRSEPYPGNQKNSTSSARLVVDNDNNIYAFGSTYQQLEGYQSLDGYDPYIAKFDKYGRKLWVKQFDTPEEGTFISGPFTGGDSISVARFYKDDDTQSGLPDYVFMLGELSFDPYPIGVDEGTVYYLETASNCAGKSYKSGPVVTTLASVESNCATPDQIGSKFKGGPKEMLLAYLDNGGYATPTHIELAGAGNRLSFLAESSGYGTISLVEVDPLSGNEVGALDSKSVGFMRGSPTIVTDLSDLSGIVSAGNTFGVKLSMTNNLRSTSKIYWGANLGCPAGSHQKIKVFEREADTVAPFSHILSPVDGAHETSSYTLVQGSTSDAAGRGVELVEVSVDGGQSWAYATDTSVDQSWSTWTYPWRHDAFGDYSLLSRARDQVGNVELPGPANNVTVVDMAPELIVNAVQSPVNQRLQTISGTSDPNASLQVVIDLPQNSTAAVSPVMRNPDGSWEFTIDGMVVNAENVITVASENEQASRSETITIIVDTLSPDLNVNAVDTPTDQSSQRIVGTVESGATLLVQVNPPSTPQAVVVSSGIWNYQANLSDGDNDIVFTATDAAGNSSVQSATITYTPPPELTVALSEAVIDSDEATDVVMTLSNVQPGVDVLVEELLDVNANGVADLGEPVIRRFKLRDGISLPDPNTQSDEDGVEDGSIVTTLNYRFTNDIHHAPGEHLFRLSDGVVVTGAQISITQTSSQQTIQGFVLDDQSNLVSGAILQIMNKWGRTVGYAYSDGSGSYALAAPEPGEFIVVPYAAGYVTDKATNPIVIVGSGEAVSQNLNLLVVANQVSGTVKDQQTSSGITGVLIRAENDQYVGSALSDSSGVYDLSLPDGDYALYVDAYTADGPSAQQYLGSLVPVLNVAVSGDSVGNDIELPHSQLLSRGKVVDQFLTGIPGIPVRGILDDGSGMVAHAVTDAQGDYVLALMSYDSWEVSVLDDAAQGLGYVGNRPTPVPAASGPYDIGDLTLYPIDAWVVGTVTDNNNQPVEGLPVELSNSAMGIVIEGQTAMDGTYRMGVHNDNWEVALPAEIPGYEPVSSVHTSLASGQTSVVDFTVSLLPQQVNTLLITDAKYTARKNTLTVDATSDYPDAALMIEYLGTTVAMNYEKLFKGKYIWSYVDTNVVTAPATVTVSGPEGSVTVPVTVK